MLIGGILLKIMIDKNQRKKYKAEENKITNKIIEFLEWNKWRVFKIYNGGVPARAIGSVIIYKKKDKKYNGVPDLICLKKGYPILFIECKRKDGIVSDEQKEFIKLAKTTLNGWADAYYSLEEVQEVIKVLNDHYPVNYEKTKFKIKES